MGLAAGGNGNNQWDWEGMEIRHCFIPERGCEWKWTSGNEWYRA